MKKAISSILLATMLAGVFSGCGARNQETSDPPDAVQGTESSVVLGTAQDATGADSRELSVGAEGILDPFAVQALEGRDNSLDAWSAVARLSLRTENPENVLEGGGSGSFLGVSRAYCFKKHLFSTAAESWDELSYVATEGERGTESFGLKNQLWGVGPVAGTDHYVSFQIKSEDGVEEDRYILMERDENHEELREFPLNFLSGEIGEILTGLSGFMVDQSGTASLIWRGKYLLVSQKGEILAEYVPEDGRIREVVPLYDGRAAFLQEGEQGEMNLQCMDVESGKPVTLAAWGKPKNNIYYVTLFDEVSLLYADKDGLYRSDLSGKNPELLYSWIHHGIIAQGISGIQTDGERKIAILYSDSDQYTYLCLEPTAEEVPICRIAMNVKDYNMDAYQWAVAEFNKQYPSCYVELVGSDNNDETTLLTQLTAGGGPVLLDPSLVGFEEMEELWEPLDNVLEQLGIMEELYPNVMEMGKINGILYGIVSDFVLETAVVGDSDLEDWDFDTFMQCVQDTPGLEAVCNYYDSESGPYQLIALLNHGLDDCYFMIAEEETGELHFGSDRFRQVLELVKKYCRSKEGIQPGNSLLEGKTLCDVLYIYKPEHVAAYRRIYGEDVRYIGFPAKEGGLHEMRASGMYVRAPGYPGACFG
ncbi:MAG TPA: hypothetical protein DCZ91_23410 [Lachnospiraceae bacterium]|nr:hypothetical protein [Lachnospiraceae bacterium]